LHGALLEKSLKNRFVTNLKATFKFVTIALSSIATYIVIESFSNENYSYLLFLFYILFMLLSVVASVFVYSKLEDMQFNIIIKAILFSILGTFTLILSYALGNPIVANDFDLFFVARMSIVSLVFHSLLYILLPWSVDRDV